MKKILYLDLSSGISGDMLIAALLSAGASFEALKKGLKKIPLKGYELNVHEVSRGGVKATKFDVSIKGKTKPLDFAGMRKLIDGSTLSEEIKKKGLSIIRSLFEAEAKVHGATIKKVHLHELGSPDTVIDILGTLICLRMLGIDEITSSPLNVGGGFIESEHGRLPVPAPATGMLLRGLPVYSSGFPYELVTPTGAALARRLVREFGGMPVMKFEGMGIGAGSKNIKEHPNVLRAYLGERDAAHDEIIVLETNIDDMDPRIYSYLMDRLFEKGALDVFLTPIIMKKSRPAVKITVLSNEKEADDMRKIIFEETSTLGIRKYAARRTVLPREIVLRKTEFGPIRFKTRTLNGKTFENPEYEDCAKAARKTGLPLKDIFRRLSS